MEACGSLEFKRKPPSPQAKAKGGSGFREQLGENSIIRRALRFLGWVGEKLENSQA